MKQVKTLIIALIALSFSVFGYAQTPELIKDINSNPNWLFFDQPEGYLEFNGKVYFAATDSIHHRELWSTDGTTAGTAIVKDINPGQPGQVHYGVPFFQKPYRTIFNGNIYFNGFDSTHAMALWKTDGTANGTVLVKDISQLGIQSQSWQEPVSHSFNEVNGRLVFLSQDTVHSEELWTTDGTNTGTQLLKDINPYKFHNFGYCNADNFTLFNNKLYFSANDSTHGSELWVTDGTSNGTHMVVDLDTYHGAPQFAYFSNEPNGLYVHNNELYFITYLGILYKTDGTANGTVLLSDSTNNYIPRITPQIMVTNGRDKVFTEMGGKLYFIGADSSGTELWTTDGTVAGTTMVKNINPSTQTFEGVRGEISVLGNNQLVFFGRQHMNGDPNYAGWELWQSDGTNTGTSLVKTLVSPNQNPQVGRNTYVYNDKVYFNAKSNTSPFSWWVSDGTANGTFMLNDSIFLLGGKPITYNNRMYLQVDGKLWESEGDSITTKMVKPIGDTSANAYVSFSNDPFNVDFYDYVIYNGSLLFSAAWGQTGLEPWKITTTPLQVLSYDKKDIDFKIFPNPASTELNIESKESILSINVFDSFGRMVVSGSNKKLFVNNLPNGLYILQIKTESGLGSAKFLIDK